MEFCPAPHTTRDQVWLLVGCGLGVGLYKLFTTVAKQSAKSKANLVSPTEVVNEDNLRVLEYEGFASTQNTAMSLAEVIAKKTCTAGPQENKFEEWLVVTSGEMDITCHDEDNNTVKCPAGHVLYMPPGRYSLNYKMAQTRYFALCVPSFAPNTINFDVKL